MSKTLHPELAKHHHSDTGTFVFSPPVTSNHKSETTQSDPAIRVLALDTSPQASALLMLSVDGDIPKFDLAMYTDRPADRPRMFAHLAVIQQRAIKAGIPILRVPATGPAEPAIHDKIREILGFPVPRPVPPGVHAELAWPVSLDTIHQATDSTQRFVQHTFPLLDLGWALGDCQGYLRSLRLDAPKHDLLGREPS
ncbi:hypothetical protein [Actinomadura oligospora]|uniref:hypothetical protein n=1 Tax=Actinomadura oligospora TaxID=111804 RepID=UPI00047AA8C2|nr:hypothetical protein [Actinomadura oligospora]